MDDIAWNRGVVVCLLRLRLMGYLCRWGAWRPIAWSFVQSVVTGLFRTLYPIIMWDYVCNEFWRSRSDCGIFATCLGLFMRGFRDTLQTHDIVAPSRQRFLVVPPCTSGLPVCTSNVTLMNRLWIHDPPWSTSRRTAIPYSTHCKCLLRQYLNIGTLVFKWTR